MPSTPPFPAPFEEPHHSYIAKGEIRLVDGIAYSTTFNASKALGNAGESILANEIGGGEAQKRFLTDLGYRVVDLAGKDGIAYEAKAGVNVQLTSAIRTQIDKDALLIGNKLVDGAEWRFYQGASQQVLDYLTSKGIKYRVY